MATTAKKKAPAKKAAAKKVGTGSVSKKSTPPESTALDIYIPERKVEEFTLTLKSMGANIYGCHTVTNKTRLDLEKKHDGLKVQGKDRPPKDQFQEMKDAGYWLFDKKGKPTHLCATAIQVKKATVDACRHVNDPNLTMIASRSWFFIFGTDKRDNQMLPLTSQHGHLPENLKTKMDYRFTDELDEEPKSRWVTPERVKEMKHLHSLGVSMRQDPVSLGVGKDKDLRYRPVIHDWSTEILVQYSPNIISGQAIINLIQLAGFHNGIGEWRPSSPKAVGSWGQFEIAG